MKVLLVPSIRASRGSGHLRRALRLARIFGAGSALLLEDLQEALGGGNPASRGAPAAQALLKPLGADPAGLRILERYDPEETWDLVVVDRRASSAEQIRRFLPVPVAGLDEGGAGRPFCTCLVDTLPRLPRGEPANVASLSLLDLDSTGPGETAGRSGDRGLERVLVSFGGEDAADLSGRLLTALLRGRILPPERITVVQGPYFRRSAWPDRVTVLRAPGNLRELLPDYDLLITQFGLTTFEALAAGVPVLHFNPSPYHRRLSRHAQIPEIGVLRPRMGRLRSLLNRPRLLGGVLERYPAETFSGSPRLSELPTLLEPSGPARCPLCGTAADRALARFQTRTYFRCRVCRMIHMLHFGGPAERYDQGYFFSRYEQQYGRTYLEDFRNIKEMALPRLARIRRAASSMRQDALRLLDVGCAFGPFLQAAAENGFQVRGLDVAEAAVRYVRGQLGFACDQGDFSGTEVAGRFDVITMWYVLEHFRNAGEALLKVNGLLRRGGVFAFSTPSASGISARRNLRRFLENSPQDHYTVWQPQSAARILRRYGFRLCATVSTGHHGERFPWPRDLRPQSIAARGFTALSRLAGLGDTFEAYALKVSEAGREA